MREIDTADVDKMSNRLSVGESVGLRSSYATNRDVRIRFTDITDMSNFSYIGNIFGQKSLKYIVRLWIQLRFSRPARSRFSFLASLQTSSSLYIYLTGQKTRGGFRGVFGVNNLLLYLKYQALKCVIPIQVTSHASKQRKF